MPLAKQVDLQCYELEELCIGETYSVSCAIPDDYSYHKVSISGGNCSYGGTATAIEFDVHTSNNEVLDETFKDDNCGDVRGTASSVHASGKSVIEVSFTATQHIEGATVTCFGQGIPPLPYLTKTCNISLTGMNDVVFHRCVYKVQMVQIHSRYTRSTQECVDIGLLFPCSHHVGCSCLRYKTS